MSIADIHQPLRGAVQFIRCREVVKGYIRPKLFVMLIEVWDPQP